MASSSTAAVPEMETSFDMQPWLWYACAGVLVKIPPVNSKVYYFVQGHMEHASATGSTVDLEKIKSIPDRILCTVEAVKYVADQCTDEVYTKIKLVPLTCDKPIDFGDAVEEITAAPYASQKLTTIDVSDDKFYAREKCASMLFPGVSSGEIRCKDVHDSISWSFSHEHRQLITGWTEFLTAKNPEAGDTLLFIRDSEGDLRTGIRRAMRNVIVNADSVVEAAKLAADGMSFEVLYYPRVGTPEFVVRADRVEAAIVTPWREGLRFDMLVEDEERWLHARTDSGKVLSVVADDPDHWPISPWKRLQVSVDDVAFGTTRELRVSPWMVKALEPF